MYQNSINNTKKDFFNVPSPLEETSLEDLFAQLQQYTFPGQTSPFINNSLPDAQINALLSQRQSPKAMVGNSVAPKTNILGETIPMNNLPKGVGYVNGKLFDSNKQSPQGMFTGYSKERDASLDKYGKVDKNSEFYKRNSQAMHNLQGGYARDQNMKIAGENTRAQELADLQSSRNLINFR